MGNHRLLEIVVGLFLVVAVWADFPGKYQLRRPLQVPGQNYNFVPNRLYASRGRNYPPVPPGTRSEVLPGENRNFIPNRYDIPASILDRKKGAPIGCVGATACGLVPPPPPPAPPMPLSYNPPTAYTGYSPQNAFQGFPPAPLPYGPQGFPANPAMLGANSAKAKLLGRLKPEKKFVPHLPPMGRNQPGKPPFVPPPPAAPKPQAAVFGQAAGQFPFQQPLSYGPQGMVPPPQPVPGFSPPAFPAPLPQTPYLPQQDSAGYNQGPPPMGAQQHDDPQLMMPPNSAPQLPSQQIPFSPEMNPGPTFNNQGQQMTLDGSYDMAKKRMVKLQMKRYGIPRPVFKSRLVPKPLFKRHD